VTARTECYSIEEKGAL
jgi:hypothetical protein